VCSLWGVFFIITGILSYRKIITRITVIGESIIELGALNQTRIAVEKKIEENDLAGLLHLTALIHGHTTAWEVPWE